MKKTLRGGKRRAWRNQHPGGGGPPKRVEVIEVYLKFRGRRYGSSYSIEKHGARKANQLANEWLEDHRMMVELFESGAS